MKFVQLLTSFCLGVMRAHSFNILFNAQVAYSLFHIHVFPPYSEIASFLNSFCLFVCFQVVLLGLDILSALVSRLQDRFKAQIGTGEVTGAKGQAAVLTGCTVFVDFPSNQVYFMMKLRIMCMSQLVLNWLVRTNSNQQ